LTRSRDNATNVAGDISGVTAGTGITGGGTSGTVTVTNDMATTINAAGDLIYGTANDAYARLAIGTARQTLLANSGATAPEWAASPQSLMTATGDILYASAANTPAKLAIGTTSQVLTVASGLPSWATPSSGGMTLIAETVASANTSISFSSLGSYTQLYLVWSGLYTSSANTFILRFNSDSNNNYTQKGFEAANNTFGGYSTAGADRIYNKEILGDLSSTPLEQGSGYLYVENYTSTTKFKNYYGGMGFRDGSGHTRQFVITSGTYLSTSAITSIDIVRASGTGNMTNVSNTSIRLYGIS